MNMRVVPGPSVRRRFHGAIRRDGCGSSGVFIGGVGTAFVGRRREFWRRWRVSRQFLRRRVQFFGESFGRFLGGLLRKFREQPQFRRVDLARIEWA